MEKTTVDKDNDTMFKIGPAGYFPKASAQTTPVSPSASGSITPGYLRVKRATMAPRQSLSVLVCPRRLLFIGGQHDSNDVYTRRPTPGEGRFPFATRRQSL